MKINLNDMLELIQEESELLSCYYNKITEIIFTKDESGESEYNSKLIQNINDYEEWEQEIIKTLYDIEYNSNNYLKLPHINDFYNEDLIKSFCSKLDDVSTKNEILTNINNYSELKLLKKLLNKNSQIDKWYEFIEVFERDECIKWCNKNKIEIF